MSTCSAASAALSSPSASAASARGDGLVDAAAGLADALACLLARARGKRADLAVGQRERRDVARVVVPGLLQFRGRGCCLDGGERVSDETVDCCRVECGDLARVEVVASGPDMDPPSIGSRRCAGGGGVEAHPRRRSKG